MALRSGFTLGDWAIYPLEGRLSRAQEERRVQPKSMEVLLHLAEADGEVVERDRLLRDIWGNRAVSDEPLTRCIGELRKALGDNRSDPDYIRTIPKRGYKLLQVATPLAKEPPGRGLPGPARNRLTLVAGVIVLGIAAFAAVNVWLGREDESIRPQLSGSVAINRSIAVLPFADMSPAGDQAYLSDGISEELLNLLTKIRELRVISRTSSFSFRETSLDVVAIARQLGVAYVLEGSVRTSGERIRITAQLVDALTDSHIWSETYDRELGDIFAIQEEIAAAVVSKLELTLLSGALKTRETSPEAYSLFLKARYLHEHTGGDSFLRAFDYYKAALEIDEEYVPAWVWLAALYDDTVNSSGLPFDEVGRLARDAIDRALTIDPQDPLALGMSGILLDAWDNDLETAAARMQQALRIDPGNPILLRWAAILLNSLGRHDDAVRVTEYLFEHDPIGNISKVNLASTYILAGRFDDAIRVCEINVALNEGTGPCQSRLIVAHLYAGDATSAGARLKAVTGTRVYVRLAPMVFHARWRSANFNTAMRAIEEAYRSGDKGMAYWLGLTHTYIGDSDAAMEWFARAADDGVLNVSPTAAYFVELQGDPRWEALLTELGRSPDSLQAVELVVHLPD